MDSHLWRRNSTNVDMQTVWKIDMKYEEIKPYIERKLISEQRHPEDNDVAIFNYTQSCQYKKKWDEITMQCRGLIMRVSTGEIIARPFKKFFNYEEYIDQGNFIPKEAPMVTEKFDGSLGILYKLNGKARIATRGSFVSEQALWATEWWHKNIKNPNDFEPSLTNLFEIIYPENRIVVNYNFSGLVYLCTIENETGKPVEIDVWKEVKETKKINAKSPKNLLSLDDKNKEGFVLYYPQADLRLKVKFPEYVRLHRLITGLSEKAIWEIMKDGKPLSIFLSDVPDEFYDWVRRVELELIKKFWSIKDEAIEEFEIILKRCSIYRRDKSEYRKMFAEQANASKYPAIMFSMLDEKDFESFIWKMVRPHEQTLSFKVDIDS